MLLTPGKRQTHELLERRQSSAASSSGEHDCLMAGCRNLLGVGANLHSKCPQLGGETLLMRLAKLQNPRRVVAIKMAIELASPDGGLALEAVLEATDDAGKSTLMHAAGPFGYLDSVEALMAVSGLSFINHLPRVPTSARGAYEMITTAATLDEDAFGRLAAADAKRCGRADLHFPATMRAEPSRS